MSDSDSCRVKRSKRIAKKRSKAITPEGNNPNQAGFVTLGPDARGTFRLYSYTTYTF